MKHVTLSFDNGPDPDVTPRVLDILSRRGIRASFFVIGKRLDNPMAAQVLQRIVDDGHWLGNHTFSHDPPLGERSSSTLADDEIGRTQRLLGGLARPESLFRPSGTKGGLDDRLLDPTCLRALVDGRYTCVLWHSVPGDLWPATDWIRNAETAIEERDWTLVVLHDILNGCVTRLEEFLDRLAARGTAIRQDFPADCLPIIRGHVTRSMDAYVRT